jgi:hypothetical protein
MKTLITYGFFALVLANCVFAVEPLGETNQGEEQQTQGVAVVASSLNQNPISENHQRLIAEIISKTMKSGPQIALAA